jgi:hypothetical protein
LLPLIRRAGHGPRDVLGAVIAAAERGVLLLASSFRGARSASPESITMIGSMDSGPIAARCPGMTKEEDPSPLDERLLDDEMAGLGVAAFDKATCLEHLAQLFQHGRAAAHHDAVGFKVERRLADIVEQLF